MSLPPFENLRNAVIAGAALLALMLTLLGPAPAGAVVGGEEIDGTTTMWFASLGCGGTLVAPDRIVTAAHCVENRRLESLQAIWVGGAVHKATRYAMAPGWRTRNGDNHLEDVAIIQLDTPVSGVTPVPLAAPGTRPSGQGWIIGTGRATPPEAGEAGFDGRLRRATLRITSDRECGTAFKTVFGNGGERFDAPRMLCAIDVDGMAPLSSGCNGDSGGPLYTGSDAAPVLLGVVSWGSKRCGADHTPSVFADVDRYRGFIADPTPAWAPTSSGFPTAARHGSRMTCTPPRYDGRPERLRYTWHRAGRSQAIGRSRTFTPGRADRGHRLACRIEASNAGGFSSALSPAVTS